MADKKRGCFFYGCLTLATIVLVVVLSAGVVVKIAYDKFQASLSDAPVAVPVAEPTEEVRAQAIAKYDQVYAGVKGQVADRVSFTADELNALIASDDTFAELRGKAWFEIGNGQVMADVSLPMEWLDADYKGKYLNGRMTFDVGYEDGQLRLVATGLVVKEEAVSRRLLKLAQTLPVMDRVRAKLPQAGRQQLADFEAGLVDADVVGDAVVFTTRGAPGAP